MVGPEGRRLDDLGVAAQGLLDPVGGDVEPADDDDVAGAAGEEEVAVGVDVAQVAGAGPAVADGRAAPSAASVGLLGVEEPARRRVGRPQPHRPTSPGPSTAPSSPVIRIADAPTGRPMACGRAGSYWVATRAGNASVEVRKLKNAARGTARPARA